MNLFINIRFYVLLFAFSLSVIFYFLVKLSVFGFGLITLTQIYAICAATFLYLALLAGPFCYTFKTFPLRAKYLKARRAIGVSAFYFALLHGYFAFFGVIGGIESFNKLDGTYKLFIFPGSISLFILLAMTATSFDFMITKLTFKKWKIIHRFVYLAGILILAHAMLIGSHFHDLSEAIPLIFATAIGSLLILEGMRIYAFLKKRFSPQKSPL